LICHKISKTQNLRFLDLPQNFKNPEPEVLRFVTKFPKKTQNPRFFHLLRKHSKSQNQRGYNKIKEPAGQQKHG
jgi:hypothetical protein